MSGGTSNHDYSREVVRRGLRVIRRVIITFAALILLGSFAFYFSRPEEPSYQGKTLTQWLDTHKVETGVTGSLSPVVFDELESVKAIRAIGTNGTPTLLSLLDATDVPRRHQINHLLSGVPWLTYRIPPPYETWSRGAGGFVALGHRAASAEPELIKRVKAGGADCGFAIVSLCAVSSNRATVLPLLVEKFGDTNRSVATIAARYLYNHYPEEAEKAGVYKRFPGWRVASTNGPAVN